MVFNLLLRNSLIFNHLGNWNINSDIKLLSLIEKQKVKN